MRKLIFFITLFIYSQVAFGDAFDWNNNNLTIQTGSIKNLENITDVKYRFGYESSGFGHLRTGIDITWTDIDGERHNQILFDGMVSFSPEKILSDNKNSSIIIRFENSCVPEPEDIFQPDLVFKYSKQKNSFEKEKLETR